MKEKIFELLGKDSRKYHSCILTTFSFDFSFFEWVAMRSLRGAGVRNILVLQDESMQHELMEHITGLEFERNNAYSLYPIKAKGVFHPKIIFCVGRKEGFLAIGSGNLTNSGHGSNDELWSVFNFKKNDHPNAKIFYQVWKYLENLSQEVRGNAKEKINWLKQYTPWLEELPNTKETTTILKNGEAVSLLPIEFGTNGLGIIADRLKEEEVQNIQLLSPFYEKKGQFLKALKTTFLSASIEVVVDPTQEALPIQIEDKANYTFYDWHKCKPDHLKEGELNHSQLHAKLIVFQLESGAELIVEGSSNATTAAFGTAKQSASNRELNLLIRKTKASTFQGLGINLRKEAIVNLEDIVIPNKQNQEDTTIKKHRKKLKIESVELDGLQLTIYSEGTYEEQLLLILLDENAQELGQKEVEVFHKRIDVSLKKEELPFFIAWTTQKKERISNRQIVHNTTVHNTCNPDPEYDIIQACFDEIDSDNLAKIADLLKYVHVEEEESLPKNNVSTGRKTTNKEITEEKVYTVTKTHEDFTTLSKDHVFYQKRLLSSNTLKIADFLSNLTSRQSQAEGIREEEQITNGDEYEGGEANDDPTISGPKTISAVQSEQKAVLKFLRSYSKYLNKQVNPLINATIVSDFPTIHLTLMDYSKFLIATQLLIIYGGKKMKSLEEPFSQDRYINLKGKKEYDNLTQFCLVLIDRFLLLQQQQPKKYKPGHLHEKQAEYQEAIYFNTLLLLCNIQWTRSNEDHIQLLLMNASNLYFQLNKERPAVTKSMFNDWILHKSTLCSYLHPNFDKQLQRLLQGDLDSYFQMAKLNQTKPLVATDSIRKGDKIYKSKLGICLIHQHTNKTNGTNSLALIRSGFKKDTKLGMPIFRQVFGQKLIKLELKKPLK